MSMIVAVAADLSDPPQQSLMLGQRASSHTVCRFNPRRSDFIFLKFVLLGMGVCNQVGRRLCSFWRPGGPTSTVREDSEELDMKSEKVGPLARRSLKEARELLEESVGGREGAAVANGRDGMNEDRENTDCET